MTVKQCPNQKCRNHLSPRPHFFTGKGRYVTAWNAQPVPRYRCKDCNVSFSSHTFLTTYRQKKPYLNHPIFYWYVSAATQRRIALNLKTNRKTVVRKFLFMAGLAKKAHESALQQGLLKTELAQFDEMETFEHTRLKPLSIALAVQGEGGIIAAEIASMKCKGPLAEIAREKYGTRSDTRKKAAVDALTKVNLCTQGDMELRTDEKPAYAPLIKRCVPKARHVQVVQQEKEYTIRRNNNDQLFRLNVTAAKIRHDLSRMARKVWVTTKKPERLQAHLDLYIAYINEYHLAA